jgi:oligoribonuclease (3'-5' exoribonuclease)
MTLVFLDTETTGLDPNRHEIWEVAYAVEDDPIVSGSVHHSLRNADPEWEGSPDSYGTVDMPKETT